MKGPLYISIFKPFSMSVAAVFGVIFLGDALCLGRYVTCHSILQDHPKKKKKKKYTHYGQLPFLPYLFFFGYNSVALFLFFPSVLGATILLLGFYAVIWGKAQVEDTRDLGPDNLGASPDRKTPLLQSYVGENLANTVHADDHTSRFCFWATK